MNAFERHGIKYLSPSSLNAYAAAPALWVMERLLKKKAPVGASAIRGRAAEAGVHTGLINPDVPAEDCIAMAQAVYDKEMALNPDHRREKEREALAHYVTNALHSLRPLGVPSGYQEKVVIDIDVSVPCIGYVDWLYADKGLVLDLKTSTKHPSELGDSHARQGAVYQHAYSNWAMRFAYVKPIKDAGAATKFHEMDPQQVNESLQAMAQIAQRLERFLSISDDPEYLAGLVVPDFEHFFWNNSTARAHGREVYGF